MARLEGVGTGTAENFLELENSQTVATEIQKTSIFAWKSTCLAIADIFSAVSRPISPEFGMVDLLGSGGVVAEPEFKIFNLLPWKMDNAAFEAQFFREREWFCHGFPSK